MSENKKSDMFKVLIDTFGYYNVKSGDIGLLLENNIYGVTLYNQKWRGHNGINDKYKGTEYENHCIYFGKCMVEKVVNYNKCFIQFEDINILANNIAIDFDSFKDIDCVINDKTITLNKDKLEKFLLSMCEESAE